MPFNLLLQIINLDLEQFLFHLCHCISLFWLCFLLPSFLSTFLVLCHSVYPYITLPATSEGGFVPVKNVIMCMENFICIYKANSMAVHASFKKF